MNVLNWTGISMPFRIENGSVAKSSSIINSKSDESPHIEESIFLIVRTIAGEWLTKTYLGSDFRSVVFSLFTSDFDNYIRYNLKKVIEEQNKRVIIKKN